MCDLRVSRCVEVLPGIAAGRAGSDSLERPTAGQASAGRTGSCGHRRLGSCGLRSVLCRSPYETYRLHHNIKAPEYRVIGKPESKLSPQANAASEQAVGGGGRASGTGFAGMARRGLLPGGFTFSAQSQPAAWRIRAAGTVHGLLLGGFTLPAKLQGALAFRSVPISGARSLSFAAPVPRLPVFWVLLQKMGPKFDIVPELLGGFRGTISRRIFLTWGNAFIEGRFSLFSPAKPPRSSDGPIAAA